MAGGLSLSESAVAKHNYSILPKLDLPQALAEGPADAGTAKILVCGADGAG